MELTGRERRDRIERKWSRLWQSAGWGGGVTVESTNVQNDVKNWFCSKSGYVLQVMAQCFWQQVKS